MFTPYCTQRQLHFDYENNSPWKPLLSVSENQTSKWQIKNGETKVEINKGFNGVTAIR